jgi:hypothetical protein
MSESCLRDVLLDILGNDRRSMARDETFIIGTGVAKSMYVPFLYFSTTIHFD